LGIFVNKKANKKNSKKSKQNKIQTKYFTLSRKIVVLRGEVYDARINISEMLTEKVL
jgi:hypothetical protein